MNTWTTFERLTYIWALVLGTVAAVIVLSGFGIWVTQNSSNVASWVQAVGALVAIGAVFGGIQYQRHMDEIKRLEDKRSHDFKTSVLLYLAYVETELAMHFLLKVTKNGGKLNVALALTIESALNQFKSLDQYSLNILDDIKNVGTMKLHLTVLLRAVNREIDKMNLPEYQRNSISATSRVDAMRSVSANIADQIPVHILEKKDLAVELSGIKDEYGSRKFFEHLEKERSSLVASDPVYADQK